MTVCLTPLKQFARKNLWRCPLTASLLESEPDDMPAQEFVTKCKVWLSLLENERQLGRS